MELVGTGPGAEVHNTAVAAPEFAGKIAGLDLGFFHGVQGGDDGRFAGIVGIYVDGSIKDVLITAVPVAVYGDDRRVGELRGGCRARDGRGSGREFGKAENIALGDREFDELRLREVVGESRIAADGEGVGHR